MRYPEATIFNIGVKLNINGNIVLEKNYVSEKILIIANKSEFGKSFPHTQLLDLVRYFHNKSEEIEREINVILKLS